MMIRSRTPSCSAGGMAGWAGSVDTAGPGVGWEFVTGGTTRMVRAGIPAGSRARGGSAGGVDGDLGEVGAVPAVAADQAGHPDQQEPGVDRLGEREVGGVLQGAGGGDGEAVEVAAGGTAGADLHGRARRRRGERDPGDRLRAAEVVDDADAGLEVPQRRRAV